MAANIIRPPRQLRRVEGLSFDDLNWFNQQALHCLQMTIATVVDDDLAWLNSNYDTIARFWLTKVFDNGFWDSTQKPSDLPKSAKSRKQWARRLEGGHEVDQQQVQTHRSRKRGAAAYMRYRVGKLLDAVIPAYLDAKCRWAPADLIDFSDGEEPSATTRAQAMMKQDTYQKSVTVNWNGHLLVYLFRKKLYEDKYEALAYHPSHLEEDHQSMEITGVRESTNADYRKTPLIEPDVQDMIQVMIGALVLLDYNVPLVWLRSESYSALA
ncbi:uncharacterized protein PG986_006807 [Apiospora aurea]|uniref:HNH nuclease domain-containing protein n=1 Tax=Apiospora aurea TaxID=335848 RepID=A0ABR1QAU3_9PEZI